MKVEGFKNLVERVWQQESVESTNSFILASKLKVLKAKIKKWVREEEGRLEGRISENLKELTDLDILEMEGGYVRMER